jgi:adenine phosphoribosyltransferase
MNLENYIRDILDFPKPGIVFKDITPLLKDPKAFREALIVMEDHLKDDTFDYFLGVEARGFIFAAALAARMNKGMIPVRKPGIPWNMEQQVWKFTKMPSIKETEFS